MKLADCTSGRFRGLRLASALIIIVNRWRRTFRLWNSLTGRQALPACCSPLLPQCTARRMRMLVSTVLTKWSIGYVTLVAITWTTFLIPCQLIDVRALLDFIYGCPIFKKLQRLDNVTGYQDRSPNKVSFVVITISFFNQQLCTTMTTSMSVSQKWGGKYHFDFLSGLCLRKFVVSRVTWSVVVNEWEGKLEACKNWIYQLPTHAYVHT